MSEARPAPPTAETLAAWLDEAVTACLEDVLALPDSALLGPVLEITNPPLWELGHVGWFLERFCLREILGEPPLRPDEDELWNSIEVPHGTRWDLPLPSLEETADYVRTVAARVRERLLAGDLAGEHAATARLAIHHADMHLEAFAYMRQTLGHPPPPGMPDAPPDPASPAAGSARPDDRAEGDVALPGGRFRLGAPEDAAFAFDNELPGLEVELEPFRIARRAVSEGEWLEFVEAGGYEDERLWSEAGRAWLRAQRVRAPAYWRRAPDGSWLVRRFDRERPPEPALPAMFLSFHEAEAFCAFAGRRLPSEAEWEAAAAAVPRAGSLGTVRRTFPWGEEPPSPERARLDRTGGGPAPVSAYPAGDAACGARQMLGNVWEWTAERFEPHPGFRPGVYREYSAPWFGTRRVLKGGSWATPGRMIWASLRNFYEPHRRDVFVGLRTCAR